MKKLSVLLAFTLLMGSVTSNLVAQQTKDPAEVKKMVEEKNYVFKAQTVIPQQGRTRQLTTEYDLTVAPDTIISFLPFFGRAFSAPINPSEGGIKFTSTDFDYTIVKQKKNGWEIKITPKDESEVQQMFLTIFDNSSASLRITSRNRSGISYNGYIVPGKELVKKGF